MKSEKIRESLEEKVNMRSRGKVVNETRKYRWNWGVARFIVDYIVDCRGVGNASGQCMSCYSRPLIYTHIQGASGIDARF